MSKKKKRSSKGSSEKRRPPSSGEIERQKSRILLAIVIAGVLLLGAALFIFNYLESPYTLSFGFYKDKNLLFITIDNLTKTITIPQKERLARESLVFQNTVAQAPLNFRILAELLKNRGYNTAAFDPSGESAHAVEAWLSQNKNSKFFLCLHYHVSEAEIPSIDPVLERLEELQLRHRTMIILTANPGGNVDVPLLISLPGGAGRDILPSVRQVDVLPTVLEWLGIPPPAELQGQSLIPLLQGREDRKGGTSP